MIASVVAPMQPAMHGDAADSAYNIVMALHPLKDLVRDDELTRPLALPFSGSPVGSVSVADYAEALPAFEQLSRERVAHLISSRPRLADNIRNILSSSPESLADVLLHIDGLVEVVSRAIDDQRATLEVGRIETDLKIAKAASATTCVANPPSRSYPVNVGASQRFSRKVWQYSQ